MTISLCMIAKDEEAHIGACLASVKDYVDEIIVVLDTRSTDKTGDIARSYDAHVVPFVWKDDFSLARNESLRHVTKDWILCLDADEVMNAKDMEKLLALLNSTEHDGFLLHQRNYTDDTTLRGWRANDNYPECKATGYHDSPIVRVFRNHKGYTFRNKVHEAVDHSIHAGGGKIADSQIPIHHYGLLKGNIEEKRDLYLSYGKAQIRDDPDSVRARYEIARIYKSRGQYKEAITELTHVARKKPDYRHTLVNLADCYYKIHDIAHAIEHYKLAIKTQPKDEIAYVNFGLLLLEQGRLTDASSMFNFALAVNPTNPAAHQNLIGTYVKEKRLGDAFSCALRAYKLTGLDKFKETAELLKSKLGREAEIVELLSEKKYTDAEKLLVSLITEQPHWHGHYINLANLYVKIGDTEKAKQILLQGIQTVTDAKGKGVLQTKLGQMG